MRPLYSTENLFSHMLIFGELNEKTKLLIFKVACQNNFRYLKTPSEKQKVILKNILEAKIFEEIVFLNEFVEEVNKAFADSLHKNNYREIISEVEVFLKSLKLDKWTSSVVLNIWLTNKNLCPFLRFAFNKWQKIPQANNKLSILSIAEFSTEYLYRLATLEIHHETENGVHIANGAHNSLFLIGDGIVKKVPTSFGAIKFVNDQEIKTTKKLLKSGLKEYIPHIISYDDDTKIIIRQYINGKTGHKLLESNFFRRNTNAITSLKRFFKLYKAVREDLKINLDIHPGNFVWDNNIQKWFFVDTGQIPFIGSDYFPLSSFKKYFQKIWKERHSRIKMMPIRSVDLDL